MNSVVLSAPAKVNLFLRVLHRRSDGFHEIETLFQAIDLSDHVELELQGSDVLLHMVGPDVGPPEENLAVRAARAVLGEIGSGSGVRIHLEKQIPAGAGLGGGSSDAAAVLRGLNVLFDHPIPAERLSEIGATLGSDVPFFLGASPLAVGTGRGERLTPLPPLPAAELVVVLPPVHVSTAEAYASLAALRTDRPMDVHHGRLGDPPGEWGDVAAFSHNDFEEVVPSAHPEVALSLSALRKRAHGPVLLSGSGAACFAVCTESDGSAATANRLAEFLGWPALSCRTLDRFPEPMVRE